MAFVKEDRQDLWVLLVYTLISALLSLAVPLAAQALVNTIAVGVFLQPLVVLSLMVFVGLCFTGVVKVLQLTLVEVLQQRLFARIAIGLAQHLPRVKHAALSQNNPAETLNNFFAVEKLQKTAAKLLLDGPAALLQIAFGLLIMAFYSPLLLAFDLVVLLALGFNTWVLGTNGLATSLVESKKLYRVAGWLQDMARCHASFKLDSASPYAMEQTDARVLQYLDARQQHFKVVFRQAVFHYCFYAVAGCGILAIGGWLVIQRQLTLGQLVASELIAVMVLLAMEKLVGLYQEGFDLLTAIDKLGHLEDLPLDETQGQRTVPATVNQGLAVRCQGVSFSYPPLGSRGAAGGAKPVLQQLNVGLQAGGYYTLVGPVGSGKSTLARVLCGLSTVGSGSLTFNGVDIRDLDATDLHHHVALVDGTNHVFEGTLEDNILCGRSHLNDGHLKAALEATLLYDEVYALPQALKTRVPSTGPALSQGQVQRLMLARALVDNPTLLVLDEAFAGMDTALALAIAKRLAALPCTVLDITHELPRIAMSEAVLVLKAGQVVEMAPPQELLKTPASYVYQQFHSQGKGQGKEGDPPHV
jgi:ATP-binding cassette subfamily B protein